VLDALLRGGHTVTALVRHANRGKQLAARGATPAVGDLNVGATWVAAARGQDAWIHAAEEGLPRRVAADRAAIDTILSAARSRGDGAPGVFIYTSGVWVLGSTIAPADEDAPLHPVEYVAWRPAHEQLVLTGGTELLRTAVVRPGIVYGGSRGIVGDLFKDGANGLIRVVGDGSNRWALLYDRDLADLYLRILTSPGAAGLYHASDEGDEPVSDIVESIARNMKTRADVRYIPLDEARAKMGTYADVLALDQTVRSPRARALGWSPTLRSVSGNIPRLAEEWRRGRES
jgi:nucleoside-diphosphate-sugar epimerase